MTNNTPLLSMIAHETDGTDSIEAGIYLRWAFNYKLGFPPNGFILYRRQSDLQNHLCFVAAEVKKSKIGLPFIFKPIHPSNPKITITSETNKPIPIEEIPVTSRTRKKVLKVDGSMHFSFSRPSSQIEIECYTTKGKSFSVTAYSDKNIVWQKKVTGKNDELITLTVGTFATDDIYFEGDDIKILKICFWICSDKGVNPWEPVNGDCGYGLPYGKTKQTKHILKAYKTECDADWSMAACRLGADKICAFKGSNFDDLKSVLSYMDGDGIKVPVGWNLFTLNNEAPTCPNDKAGEAGLKISPYDAIIMQSQNPDIARILGLYWVDNKVAENTYYDYKISADWPEEPRTLWKLQNEVTFENIQIGHTYFPLINNGEVILHGQTLTMPGRVIGCSSDIARVDRGIAFDYPRETIIRIYFAEPTREVQVFLSQEGLESKIHAYVEGNQNPVDWGTLTAKEGVLAVHSHTPIRMVRLRGKGIIIMRVHYDEEYLPYDEQYFIICGLKKRKPLPLETPTSLKAVCLKGRITETRDDCSVTDHRFTSGLRWDIPVNDNGEILFSNAPIAYHIKRTTPRNEEILVTKDNPVHVIPDDPMLEKMLAVTQQLHAIESRTEVEPIKERQCYIDAVNEKGQYGYKVAAVDMFGRQSKFSKITNVLLIPPLPPPPANVNAKYLDFETYDTATDTFSDPNLNQAEKEWLKINRKSAIVVRWEWLPDQQRQAPDALGFRIKFQHGWLNLLQSNIDDVSKVDKGYEIKTKIKYDIAKNALVGEWLRQGKMTYKINHNDRMQGGSRLIMTVDIPPKYLKLSPHEAKPKKNEPFVLPLTRYINNKPNPGAAIDYRDPLKWNKQIAEVNILLPSQEAYEIYIPDPSFPDPPFNKIIEDYKADKTRYAQIGVSTFSEEGEGSVSSPSTIMAIYRTPPISPEFQDSTAEKATPADYYGKSTYTLTLPTPPDSNVKFFIYRAMDESIFMIDKANRPLRNNEYYENFLNNHPEFKERGRYALSLDELTALRAVTPVYKDISKQNNLLKALASLPGNEEAFSRLNHIPIRQVYKDETLDGRGDNRYFYRTRPIDEIGNLGAFSVSTLPVEIPKVTPPLPPDVSAIIDDRITIIKWSKKSSTPIVKYLIYRTSDVKKSKEWRKMDLIKSDTAANFITDLTAPHKYKYIDSTIEPYKNYYYGIRSEDDCGLISEISKATAGNAYDYSPPIEPNWLRAEWVKLDNNGSEYPWSDAGANLASAIALEFSTRQGSISAMLKRTRLNGGYKNIGSWIRNPVFDQARNVWIFKIYDSKADITIIQKYKLKLMNKAGIELISTQEQSVSIPE